MDNISYKYLIKPNKNQKEAITQIFKYVTKVRAMYIDDLQSGNKPSYLAKEVYEEYVKRDPKLLNCDKSAIINELFILNDFRSELGKNDKKRLHSYTSACFNTNFGARVVGSEAIYMPKVGQINMKMHRPLYPGSKVRSITIVYDSRDNKYYASILLAYEMPFARDDLDVHKSIGLDYSAKHFIVDSNGRKYEPPKPYRTSEETLTNLQAKMSKLSRTDADYKKVRDKFRRCYLKTINQRNDYIHQVSRKLANEYDYIFVETLDMEQMSKELRLGKSTKDNAYSAFLEKLSYKLKMQGKKLIKVNKWFPSSKRCNACGYIKENLTLNDRLWICPKCGSYLDRDINAAKNIRDEGIKYVNVAGHSTK